MTSNADGFDGLDEVVGEFLVESHENLDRLDQELVDLEQHPEPATIASIFRTIHTIKGTSGFLGYSNLERVTHVGENLLSRLRDGKLSVTADITSALLAMVDAVRRILADIEHTGAEGPEPFDALVELLDRLKNAQPVPAPEPPAAEAEPSEEPRPIGEILVAEGKATVADVAEAIARQEAGDPRHVGELLVEKGTIEAREVAEALLAQQEQRTGGPSVSESSIRVDVGLLDNLMNLVGELVLARNQILQFTQSSGDAVLTGTSQRLNLITTELQEGVMKTRMQPIENVWNKFPRVVRDLSLACGKQIRIEMEGKDTELDKTIIEAIKDPLTHLVRNSVDHGIESPERRVELGKGREGVVRLRAYHEGGQVIIEISDDGAGMSAGRIRAKAVERDLISVEAAASMGQRELLNLIFLPGFSTAEKVSNISGRGVGMDVVKTNIEAIGGNIDVQTREGVGTTFKIKIPLTLAIIPALLVGSGGERYAIPQVSLLELVRLDRENASAIEHVHGTPVYRLRGRLLPLVFLDQVLRTRSAVEPAGEVDDEDGTVNIVVLQADGEPFGLVVSEISDTAEIVVKPLGRTLKGVRAFAGATIMGDGRVALILDALGLAEMAGVTGGARDHGLSDADAAEAAADRRTLLLFSLGDRRLALLLEMVARLEEFDPSIVERAGSQRVVQYRDEILPLVFLADELGFSTNRREGDPLRVVVYTAGGRSVGLVVDEIHDIVEQALDVQRHTAVHGLAGSAVVQGRVTDVLDIHGVLRRALAGLFAEAAA
ncbi:MAG TPA: chemotaxis protein CheA [Acidimicrobiales bacterium]|nr:chemotaxis protein CheA [Acidimicrobiales bacterium]